MSPNFIHCGEMTTEIVKYQAEYLWTIKNWKAWLESNSDFLRSSVFDVNILDEDGCPRQFKFQLIAKPHRAPSGKQVIGFKLMSLDARVPRGSFKFTLMKNNFRMLTSVKWDPIPFQNANNTISCLFYHPSKTITLKVVLNIIVPLDDRSLPKYSEIERGWMETAL